MCSLAPDIVPDQDPLKHRATPERSLDQRIDALSTANEVRKLRAQLKRDLKARRVSIGALLLDPPAYLETAKVFDMLLAVPKVGSVKATNPYGFCRQLYIRCVGRWPRIKGHLEPRAAVGDYIRCLGCGCL